MADIHIVKSWPEFFEPIRQGFKTFDLRYNDRDYKVGDVMICREWDPSKSPEYAYSGRIIIMAIDYIMEGGQFGLGNGYVAISFTKVINL